MKRQCTNCRKPLGWHTWLIYRFGEFCSSECARAGQAKFEQILARFKRVKNDD